MYAEDADPPAMIDLTGGQPDLVPEWVPWTMDALRAHGLAERVYLWSDDNLSNDYFWRHLSDRQIEQVATWPNYGRVGCFKGFDEASFTFNTMAAPELFGRQFEVFRRLLALGLDMYAYVTFTSPGVTDIEDRMSRFVDRLQQVHPNLPLRTVPLEIQMFGPVKRRLNSVNDAALGFQRRALDAFEEELARRFSSGAREMRITQVALTGMRHG